MSGSGTDRTPPSRSPGRSSSVAVLPARPSGTRQALTLLAVLLLAANLRVAVASLGVLLPQVQAALGLSDTVAGLLTTVPVWCFAVFGSLTPAVSARWGLNRTVTLALLLTAAGLAVRPLVHGGLAFVLLTALATAGAAFGNVALPALARAYFPGRVPLASALFGAALVGGNAVAAGTTVPLAGALGGWAPALGSWTLLALLALVASFALQPTRPSPEGQPRTLSARRLVRSRLAWAMVLLFGCQSATAYAQFGWLPTIFRDGGLSAGQAGWMLAVVTGVSLPLTLLLPLAMRITGHGPWLPVGFSLLTVVGWLGVLLAPSTAPWLWAALLGAGSTVFTWVLALLGQKSRTLAGTAALSGFVQGLGYLLATAGPFGAAWLHELTGTWTPTLLGLVLLAALTGAVGAVVNRPRVLEDDLQPAR